MKKIFRGTSDMQCMPSKKRSAERGRLLGRISALLLVLVLVFGLGVSAFAADGTVSYDGGGNFTFGPGSELSDTQLFPNFENAMPGDELVQTVTVKNNSSDSDYIKIYLRAEAHDENGNPLETKVKDSETEVTANDFLAQLSMTVENGSELIYEASPDKTAGLTEPVLLGRLNQGESLDLTVTLKVPIDLGNEYANRRGEVDWIFTVEELNEDADLTITLTETSQPKDKNGYQEGETITYDIVVENTGNVTLLNVVIVDPETGETWTIDKLEPGQKQTFPTKHTVTGDDVAKGKFENTAYASGTPDNPDLAPVSDSDSTGSGADDPDHAKGFDSKTGKAYSGRVMVSSNTYKPAPAPTPEPPAPQTGDTAQTGLWTAMAAVALAAIAALLVIRRRRCR